MRGVPLRLLLEDPLLARARVPAGSGGLDREVIWLSSVDSPYGEGGEAESILLASEAAWYSGYAPGTLESLAGRGCAALFARTDDAGQKTRLPGAGAPGGFLKSCDLLGLPFVVLDPGSGYREVSRALAGLLLNRNSPVLSPEAGEGSPASELARALQDIDRGEGGRLRSLCFPARLEDLREWPEIRDAVRGYLRHRGNAVAAAAALGVHRHTIRSRVRRYEELSGLVLDDPVQRPLIELAFLLETRAGGLDPATPPLT